MNAEQLELIAQSAPMVDWDEVRPVIRALKGRDWMRSDELLVLLGHPITEIGRRRLRAIASASRGFILSYPGSPGYKLTTEATITDVQAADTIRSQANKMTRRWTEIERVYHRKQRCHA